MHKQKQGAVDLSFSGINEAQLRTDYGNLLDDDMEILQTGKSAVVRTTVPRVNRFDPFETQRDLIELALNSAERLHDLYKKGHM